jgi:hypothetical protein
MKKFLSFLSAGIFAAAVFLPMAAEVSAEGIFENAKAEMLYDSDRPDDVISSDFRTAIRGFLNYFLGFLGLIAVAVVVYGGIMMVTAQGDDGQIGKAKKMIMWAMVGIVIVLLSYAIVSLFINLGTSVA